MFPCPSRVTQAWLTGAPSGAVACGIGYLYPGTGFRKQRGGGGRLLASAPPTSGPIAGIPCVIAVGPCDSLREKKIWGLIYFLFDGVRTVSSFETSCARSTDFSLSRFSRLHLTAGKSLAPGNPRRDHSGFPRSKERRNWLCCSGIFPTTVSIRDSGHVSGRPKRQVPLSYLESHGGTQLQ